MTPPENAGRQGAGLGTNVPPWQRVTREPAEEAADRTSQMPTVDPDKDSNGGFSLLGGLGGRRQESAPSRPAEAKRPATRTSTTRNPTTKGRPSGASGARGGRSNPSALRRPGRGPRRASLQVKRIDPWSVLKLSLVLGVAMFLVWMVAVGLLYIVLDGMGVWTKLNGTYSSLVSGAHGAGTQEQLITAGSVFGIAGIIGAINIVLLSALATVSAFIYNVSADLAGGLEITLSERD